MSAFGGKADKIVKLQCLLLTQSGLWNNYQNFVWKRQDLRALWEPASLSSLWLSEFGRFLSPHRARELLMNNSAPQ